MKILIKYRNDNNKLKGFSLVLPNFLLKSNIIINNISKSLYKKQNILKIINDINNKEKNLLNFLKVMLKKIKYYTKKYGHFTLIEFSSEDAQLKIII